MSKTIALAVGMTGAFFPAGAGYDAMWRAKITRVWSETCVNLSLEERCLMADPTSVFVPPQGTPVDQLPAGNYFLPDDFLPGRISDGLNGSDAETEQAIVQAGADKAPRITPDDIEANIASTWYINAGDGVVPDDFQPPVPAEHPLRQLTFCVLVLKNGFTVTGESACASPANYNAEIGRRIARENAVAKIWPLMGYELRSQLAAA